MLAASRNELLKHTISKRCPKHFGFCISREHCHIGILPDFRCTLSRRQLVKIVLVSFHYMAASSSQDPSAAAGGNSKWYASWTSLISEGARALVNLMPLPHQGHQMLNQLNTEGGNSAPDWMHYSAPPRLSFGSIRQRAT